MRWLVLACVALISAAVVAAAGIIGWVGLVIPHFARMLIGPDHRVLIPATALIGAIYLIIVDDVARASIAAEIPIGIIHRTDRRASFSQSYCVALKSEAGVKNNKK